MAWDVQQRIVRNHTRLFGGPVPHICHCAFPIYANVPVCDERGRYCSACGHYEFEILSGDSSILSGA